MDVSIADETDIWVRAACQVLATAMRPLHSTEIKCEILQKSLVGPGLTTTLDGALARESTLQTARVRPTNDKPGCYMLAELPVKAEENSTINIKQEVKSPKHLSPNISLKHASKSNKIDNREAVRNKRIDGKRVKTVKANSTNAVCRKVSKPINTQVPLSKYEQRYRRLRQLAKDLIFINAAYCDEVVNTEARVAQATQERKFLLSRLLHMQTLADASSASQAPHSSKPQASSSVPRSSPATSCKSPQSSYTPHTPSGIEYGKEKRIKRKMSQATHNKSGKISKLNSGSGEICKSKMKRPRGLSEIYPVEEQCVVDEYSGTQLPLHLPNLTICNLGKVVSERPGYHTEEHLYPVGFRSMRRYLGISQNKPSCQYTCTIVENNLAPLFEIQPEGEKQVMFRGNTATECHNKLLLAINATRLNNLVALSDKGAEFFGFNHPAVQRLLQFQPETKKCSKYIEKQFRADATHELFADMDPSVNLDVILHAQAVDAKAADSNRTFHQNGGLLQVPANVPFQTTLAPSAPGLLIPLLPNG